MSKPLRLDDFKRGTTFLLPLLEVDNDDNVLPLNGAEVASQIRDTNGVLVATLEFVLNDAESGRFDGYLQLQSGDTSTWPLGDLRADVKVSRNGIVDYSETFFIPVVVSITDAQD